MTQRIGVKIFGFFGFVRNLEEKKKEEQQVRWFI